MFVRRNLHFQALYAVTQFNRALKTTLQGSESFQALHYQLLKSVSHLYYPLQNLTDRFRFEGWRGWGFIQKDTTVS